MVIKHVKREYSISDKDTGAMSHQLELLELIHTVPDLNNDELCSIIDLEVGQSWDIDTNITVIRTA